MDTDRHGWGFMAALYALLLWVAATGCVSGTSAGPRAKPGGTVIAFDLSAFDADGLRGPPDGKRAVAYEFCIPDGNERRHEVHRIDPTVRFHRGSPGRVGCGPGEVLCIGSTHQPGFAEVLSALAALPYVERIQECFFE